MNDRDPSLQSLGDYLRTRREQSGATLRGLGGAAFGSAYLSQIETGRIKEVSATRLIAIADAYELPISIILRDVYGVDTDPGQTQNDEANVIGAAVQALPEPEKQQTIDWINFQLRKTASNSSQPRSDVPESI